MNTQDFCYWLQGYFELSGIDEGLSKEQVEVIKEHLQLVFRKENMKSVSDKRFNMPLLTEEEMSRVADNIRRLRGCESVETIALPIGVVPGIPEYPPGTIVCQNALTPPPPPEPPPTRQVKEGFGSMFGSKIV